MLQSTPQNDFKKVILERMKTTVDKIHRDHMHQPYFRKCKSCTDPVLLVMLVAASHRVPVIRV